MKEIIEQLQEKSQQVPVPLELPDEDLLVEIEEQILIPMPADFKAFLLEVSDLIVGTLEPVTVTDPYSHTYLPEVAAEAWANGLPREYIPICAKPTGYYAINEAGEILYWADGDISEDGWDSIWHWAEDVWLVS